MNDTDRKKYDTILNKDYSVTNIGELKKVLEQFPDDWVLVKTVNEEVIDITFIQTHFHGAIEF